MTKTIPGYLRIHNVSDSGTQRRVGSSASKVEQFWDAYARATGWRLDPKRSRSKQSVALLPAVAMEPMMTAEDLAEMPQVSEQNARGLAEAALMITDDLRVSRQRLRRQAAELAARAAVVVTESDQLKLAKAIERILADASMACGCQAAALYLLDDDTSQLSLRFSHPVAAEPIDADVRELRGSRGDLEALVQGVVAIDCLGGPIDTWNAPCAAESAICASVSVDDLPIGTLWLFSDEPRSFGEAAIAAARMAASHVARELSFATVQSSRAAQRSLPEVRDIAAWQHRSLPQGTALAADWGVDGMIESPRPWAIGWHTWDVLPDGTLLIAIAEAVEDSITGAMVAAAARTALTAHAGYRHTPKQLMQRISDTLWQTNSGDQLISLLCARIEPETGEGEIASAGKLTAMIASRYGYRPLATEMSDPIGTSVDPRSVQRSFHLTRGETLFACGSGWEADGATQQSLGQTLRDSLAQPSPNPLASIRREHAKFKLGHERGAVAVSRQAAGTSVRA